ncbi:hypothetical protein C0584_03725 [Candidatus Parcubacteria bacterium]|nr:MAG: hypothetical protein C0584_03725 [Candidatus Parcubacteria bacterium]
MEKINNLEQKEKYIPKIEFYTSVEDELQNFMYFLEDDPDWFRGREICVDLEHLLDEPDKEKARNEAREYFTKFFRENSVEVERRLKEASDKWSLVSEEFYSKVNKIYKNHSWPEGNYRGLISIMRMYPRNIEDKTFSFPYKEDGETNVTIAHEMMHFIQYDYLEKINGLEPSEAHDKDKRFWEFTEEFNRVIEKDSIWDYLGGKERESRISPELHEKIKKLWEEKRDVDYVVENIFPEAKKSSK